MQAADYRPTSLTWTTQSKNSSESMPCGGCDIGMNVWVENGDVLIYATRSGWLDENGTLLKAGRWRLKIDGNPLAESDFKQTLNLDNGNITISAADVKLQIWADVETPVFFIDIKSGKKRGATLSYESWRFRDLPLTKAECQQSSWKWIVPENCLTFADSIKPEKSKLRFYHHNRKETVHDFTMEREGIDGIKDKLYNPLSMLRMDGEMTAPAFTYAGTADGKYASTDYRAWQYKAASINGAIITVKLSADAQQVKPAVSLRRSAEWWRAYWQRSYIITDTPEAQEMVRNYELFRFLLGCNAKGALPTKFNGGLFTFDPVYVGKAYPFTPDFRLWGGATMTAQNQRLVYWPMLKSGDTDMMTAQFDTYLRMLPTAVERTRYYWGHDGASFTEQIECCGLPNPAEYGKHKPGQDMGTERNAWLEYLWDTQLEFCSMILDAKSYAGMDIEKYDTLIRQCIKFFPEHYRQLAVERGPKALDGNGHLVIFPGSGCETYKQAYNPSSTIAALIRVCQQYGDTATLKLLPPIPLRDNMIAPAEAWARIQNVETPQLYPVWPWRLYGVGRPDIDIAINTYRNDAHALSMRDIKGWKQDNIWAACLGLTDDAADLNTRKFASGPYRYPAFWDQGFDWAPDHNRGGAAMIGLQEMLLQEKEDGELILFPAWPKSWNAKFRLHASGGRVVEAEIKDGKVTTTK
ncbi:MAG: hypothetical protein J1E57_06225 [Prevotella sp.]|nr:hypothetical protein [Prevotella sp.]